MGRYLRQPDSSANGEHVAVCRTHPVTDARAIRGPHAGAERCADREPELGTHSRTFTFTIVRSHACADLLTDLLTDTLADERADAEPRDQANSNAVERAQPRADVCADGRADPDTSVGANGGANGHPEPCAHDRADTRPDHHALAGPDGYAEPHAEPDANAFTLYLLRGRGAHLSPQAVR